MPVSPLPPGAGGGWREVAWFGAGLAVASAGFLAYQVLLAPGSGPTITVPPRPSAVPVVVQVVGRVRKPGVYHLSPAGRVQDAVKLAGGATSDGDPASLDLAAHVSDGERIVVPGQGTPAPSQAPTPVPGRTTRTPALRATKITGSGTTAPPVNLNTATLQQLLELPGVGPATARKILAHRQQAPFASVEELRQLKLVSAATFARIQNLVTVD